MTVVKHQLFSAFRDDHAVLGKGLHTLRTFLLAGDIDGLRTTAKKLDADAGAHIAFEEEDFYPALKAFLSEEEVDAMYEQHAHGSKTLAHLARLGPDFDMSASQKQQFLEQLDQMEQHVSDCGELFGAMGGLDKVSQDALMKRLLFWREQAPNWTDIAKKRSR